MNLRRTLNDKLWDEHVVRLEPDGSALLYIDRQLIHEVTSPQAFEQMHRMERPVWRASANLAMPDHNVPTRDRTSSIADPLARAQVAALSSNCVREAIPLFDMNDLRQGIVHVVGPEQGFTLPGLTLVCGDSHTSTHGAFGALAFGVGTSEVEHVLSTQTLVTRKSKNMRIHVDGLLPQGLFAKDIALAVIRHIGTSGGRGYAMEFSGDVIRALSMEGRMTICNMAIEAGARTGLIAVDDTTIDYLRDRPMAPAGKLWEQAQAHWRTLHSDAGATWDAEHRLDVTSLAPQVTWGTTPAMTLSVNEQVPDPQAETDTGKSAAWSRALDYMGLEPGRPILDIELDKVFIGSCTNARLQDLRDAADIVRRLGGRVAKTIRQALVVPGSGLIRRQAEQEGLDQIFKYAGFEWREAGCSMCLAMNDDGLSPGERCASTSNRNFEGRQGAGGRSHLVSPAMAAAAALHGRFVDVRTLYL